MHPLRTHVRRYVREIAGAATAYHRARHVWQYHYGQPRRTSFGFSLVGDPAQAAPQFEPSERAALLHLLDTTQVFVDVGANIGFYTCLAASRGVHTVAIEPLRPNLDFLMKNVVLNRFVERVEIFPVGVGASPGLLEMYGWSTGASFVAGWAGQQINCRVPVSTLDIVLARRFDDKQLTVKVDVEGAELALLKGAGSTLAMNPKPRWLVEICLTENTPDGVNPHFEETFDVFFSHGYVAHTVDEKREVRSADIRRWVSRGARDFGSYNFIFTARP